MYHIGEILIYGAHGACRVVEHTHSQTGGKPVTYLVLEPLGQTGARSACYGEASPAHDPGGAGEASWDRGRAAAAVDPG